MPCFGGLSFSCRFTGLVLRRLGLHASAGWRLSRAASRLFYFLGFGIRYLYNTKRRNYLNLEIFALKSKYKSVQHNLSPMEKTCSEKENQNLHNQGNSVAIDNKQTLILLNQ